MPEGLIHVVILTVALLGGGGLAILVLAPLVFDDSPPGLRRARPFIVGVALLAVVLIVTEWVGSRHGSI